MIFTNHRFALICSFIFHFSIVASSQTRINHLADFEIDAYVRLGWINVEGEIEDAFSYWDSLGENVVVLSKLEVQYDTTELKGWGRGRIYVYLNHFVKRGDSMRLACQVLDYSDVHLETDGDIRVWRLKFEDADRNGILECYFAYSIHPDATDCCYPSELKVIVHEDSEKYAIRGSSEVRHEFVNVEGEKHVDGFNSLLRAAPAIQAHANNLFDKMAEELKIVADE